MTDPQAPSEYPRIYDEADTWRSHGLITAGSYVSCGVTMISGLYGTPPKEVVDKILKERALTDKKTIREAFVVFSDTDHKITRFGGNAICKYIRENNLGDIMEMGPRMNPNTGNLIKIWVWAPPHENLTPYYKNMPVFGKQLVRGPSGWEYIGPSDPRFKEQQVDTRAREA